MQNKLLPCPFCGGEAKAQKEIGGIFWKVKCEKCSCEVGRCWFGTKTRAIEAWNTRKPIERIVEQLEESKTNYEHMGTIQSAYYDKGLDKAIDIVRKGGVDNAE